MLLSASDIVTCTLLNASAVVPLSGGRMLTASTVGATASPEFPRNSYAPMSKYASPSVGVKSTLAAFSRVAAPLYVEVTNVKPLPADRPTVGVSDLLPSP